MSKETINPFYRASHDGGNNSSGGVPVNNSPEAAELISRALSGDPDAIRSIINEGPPDLWVDKMPPNDDPPPNSSG